PSGPGILSPTSIGTIVAALPEDITTFYLTSKQSALEIIDEHRLTQTDAIQIVDEVTPETYEQLRDYDGQLQLIQVIHVGDHTAIEQAMESSRYVDMILLDSGRPSLQIKELGGTGRTHDWRISSQIINSVNIPVWLAGGLRSSNVGEAIQECRPYGVDLCSGVRSEGLLDPKKLAAFVRTVRETTMA
ncbi:MAG: phosphoribosylanthranilate isomerase, partial [Bacteroidota bacterium]